ncbi:MAG: hypothetical protein Q9162_005680 [Coniocarpon cinnabarinum]
MALVDLASAFSPPAPGTGIANLVDPVIDTLVGTLHNTLSQVEQNGGGIWGLLPSPQLPAWVGGPNANQPYDGGHAPWAPINTTNSNPYTSAPDTGKTRYYDFTIAECTIAPDGVELPNEVCINGQFPGPMIEANYGDWIEDGPTDYDNITDLGPVMLNEWYHNNYSYLVHQVMAPNEEIAVGGPNAPSSQNNLINGKMAYDCSKTTLPCTPNAGLSKFNFTSGATHKLRLINTGAASIQKFSIDGHNLTVVANDYVPIQPYTTDHVSLGIGQRADVLVNGTGKPGEAYWMRSNIRGCGINNDGISPLALAAIYYEGAPQDQKPNTTSSVNDASQQYCANDPLQQTIPVYEENAPEPSVTETINMELKSNGTHQLYYMNNISFRADYNNPVLQQVHEGNLTFDRVTAVHNYGTNATVRLVVLNYDTQPHPMHLHGHNMQILNVGFGPWDGTVVRQSNPQRRDVQLMPPGSPTNPTHMVVQWFQDNPGVWPFHCHIAWHLSAGLYFTVLENPDAIQDDPKFRPTTRIGEQTCRGWDAFTRRVVVDQIDDGV